MATVLWRVKGKQGRPEGERGETRSPLLLSKVCAEGRCTGRGERCVSSER